MAEHGARGSLTESPTLWNEATKQPRIIRASRAHKRSEHRAAPRQCKVCSQRHKVQQNPPKTR